MKINLTCLILIFTTLACVPNNYKFKENPVYILKEALASLERRDPEKFAKIAGKEALCLYANDSGLQQLADHFPYREDGLKVEHRLLDSQYNTPPKFVGHWSYKTERHLFSISEKTDAKKIMDVLLECNFGNEGEKLKGEDQRNERKYVIKQCRLIKVMSQAFSPTLPKQCENLRVNYAH